MNKNEYARATELTLKEIEILIERGYLKPYTVNDPACKEKYDFPESMVERGIKARKMKRKYPKFEWSDIL